MDGNNNMIWAHEVAVLPLRAQVAFAARCAYRVEPLFYSNWLVAPEEHQRNFQRTLEFSRKAAAGTGICYEDAAWLFESLEETSRVAKAEDGGAVLEAVLRAAERAGSAAVFADLYESSEVTEIASASASAAISCVIDSGIAVDFMLDAIRSDLSLLREAAECEKWTDDMPVPQEFFGPLWPRGEPPGWPALEEPSGDEELVLQVEVPDNASEAEIIEVVKQLADHADTLDRAYGGSGLQIKSLEATTDLFVPEEVRQ